MSKETQSAGSDRRQVLWALESESQERKRQHSIVAHGLDQERALEISRRMVEIADALYDADPTPKRLKNLEYARYYEAVSGCVVAQLLADFEHSPLWRFR